VAAGGADASCTWITEDTSWENEVRGMAQVSIIVAQTRAMEDERRTRTSSRKRADRRSRFLWCKNTAARARRARRSA
jgi:hypothetical protein